MESNYITTLHPSTKFLYPLFVTVSIFVIPSVLYGYAILPLSIILAFIAGKGKNYTKLIVSALFLLIIFIFIFQAIIAPGETVIWSWWIIEVNQEGIESSLILTSRIVAIASAFLLFFQVTSTKEISKALEDLGVSSKLSFAIISIFQFIPEIRKRASNITDAQKSRGIETEGSIMTRLKAFIPILSPLISNSIFSTEEQAIALETRGFSISTTKTSLYTLQKRPVDRVIQLIFVILFVVIIVWRLINWL